MYEALILQSRSIECSMSTMNNINSNIDRIQSHNGSCGGCMMPIYIALLPRGLVLLIVLYISTSCLSTQKKLFLIFFPRLISLLIYCMGDPFNK